MIQGDGIRIAFEKCVKIRLAELLFSGFQMEKNANSHDFILIQVADILWTDNGYTVSQIPT